MNESSALFRRLILLAWAVAAWTALYGAAWAQEAEKGGGGGGGAQAYVLPYFTVFLGIFLGMLLLCRSARRWAKPRGEKFELAAYADIGKGGEGVPVITVGMRIDQVNKLLGKPAICRRGDDIYREQALAGKLSEEDAAKEHSVYEHPAGRYEIVCLDKRVVEIKSQPKREESKPS